jgi:hypothetical protein
MRLRRALLFAVARGSGADTRARLMPSTSPSGFFSRPALALRAPLALRARVDFDALRFVATRSLPSV